MLEWGYTIEDDADYRTHNMVKEVMKNNLQDLEMEIKQIERVKMKAMDNKIEQLKMQKTQSQQYIKKNKPWDFSLHWNIRNQTRMAPRLKALKKQLEKQIEQRKKVNENLEMQYQSYGMLDTFSLLEAE